MGPLAVVLGRVGGRVRLQVLMKDLALEMTYGLIKMKHLYFSDGGAGKTEQYFGVYD